jgi:hypothetical protein
MTKRIVRAVVVLALLLGLSTVATVSTASPAGALCAQNPMEGDWHNINASNPSMARVIVETCQPITTCNGNICQTTYDAGTYLTPFGKCSPTNCNWGRRLATDMGGGWMSTTHNFGFKTSYVWVKTYEYYGLTYLRVWVNNDFTPADGRTDYITDEWFLK